MKVDTSMSRSHRAVQDSDAAAALKRNGHATRTGMDEWWTDLGAIECESSRPVVNSLDIIILHILTML
jgi:hypothetical protein